MRGGLLTNENDQVVHTIHSSRGVPRNKALDLFRTLSMLFVVVQHSIVHGLNLSQLKSGSIEGTSFSLFILNGLVVIGVNGFFLLSGFFGIKEIKSRKILKLWGECILYSVIWCVINAIIHPEEVTISYLVKSAYNSFFPQGYWFFLAYMCMLLLCPYIERGISQYELRSIEILGVILFAINSLLGFGFKLIGIGNGYTLFHGLYMYILGSLCRREISKLKRLNRYIWIFLYLIFTFLTGFLSFQLNQRGDGSGSWNVFAYNNPLVVTSSISLFIFFATMQQRKAMQKFSQISPYLFSVYIITDHPYARPIAFYALKALTSSEALKIVLIIINALIIMALAILIDFLLKRVLRQLISRRT